jgi:hypothetical protein
MNATTKRTQDQLRKPLAIDGHGIRRTAKNGAHIIDRGHDGLGRAYVLASYRGEWVVWRQYAPSAFQHGRYFGTDYDAARAEFIGLTWERR